MAQFLWGCIRDVTWCSWAPPSFTDVHTLSASLSGLPRRVAWISFSALTWTLCQIRNKALIEGVFFNNLVDDLYK